MNINKNAEEVQTNIEKKIGKASAEQVGEAIAQATTKEQLIYVGPQLKWLQRFSVFKNGYPTQFKEHLEKSPAFKKMFVPVAELSNVQIRLNDSSTVESMFYGKTKEYFEGVK